MLLEKELCGGLDEIRFVMVIRDVLEKERV
jgi:hypothetical protein